MFNFFKKNSKLFSFEGDDGVGKTTFIKKLLEKKEVHKAYYMHFPSNLILDVSNFNTDDFDSKLKQVENYKDAVSKLPQSVLFESLLTGYNNLLNLYNQNKYNTVFILDRSFISNLVYDENVFNQELVKGDIAYKMMNKINDFIGTDLLYKITYILGLYTTIDNPQRTNIEKRYISAFKGLNASCTPICGYIENLKEQKINNIWHYKRFNIFC